MRKDCRFSKKIKQTTSLLSRYKKKSFQELNDWFLAVLGAAAFLIAGYLGLVLGAVVPTFIEITNEHGISLTAVGIAILLGVFGICFWFFSCIAVRCNALIYERWFN
ncbi:hypothetical protein [Thiopseudomonas alkaliphila]|uniref:hypothetical protein n=1 Tax=Thiopseudomonas alkaliphila TaxID=1697053 RepID=UPI00069D6C4F|nr:hypothetical protein [Thiopseudomonas alkaliphila]